MTAATKIERSGPAIRANPLSEQESAQVERARTGELAGLLTCDEHGNWIRL